MENNLKDLIDKLEYAKKAVLDILKDSDVLVDMHGLAYWADRVEKLREEIKELI